MKLRHVWALVLAGAIASCDGGLAPPEREAGPPYITGLITYRNWPPADSIRDLRLVLFKNFPPGDYILELQADDGKGNKSTIFPYFEVND